MFGFKSVGLIALLLQLQTVKTQTFSDRKDAIIALPYDYLNNFYSLRPVSYINDTLTVSMDLNIVAIIDFDAQNGFIEISGYLDMYWSAPGYVVSTSPAYLENFTDLVLNSVFWKPPIVLVNALRKSEEIGTDESVKIRYTFDTKECSWRPWLILRGACTPDVRFYPFDKQSCSFKLAASGYNSTELMLTPNSSDITFNFFEENGEWTVTDTSSKSLTENSASIIEYTIKLTRRPVYYVINILAPVILLGLLNVFVFILPTSSGERISYAMTCFLAYVLFLNSIMAFLPTSAAPLSYLSYYTFIMTVFSASMALATIFTIRVYHKSETDKLPACLTGIYRCLQCRWLRTSQTNAQENETSNSNDKILTWKKVAYIADVVFFLGFLIGQVFYSVAYLIPLVLGD